MKIMRWVQSAYIGLLIACIFGSIVDKDYLAVGLGAALLFHELFYGEIYD